MYTCSAFVNFHIMFSHEPTLLIQKEKKEKKKKRNIIICLIFLSVIVLLNSIQEARTIDAPNIQQDVLFTSDFPMRSSIALFGFIFLLCFFFLFLSIISSDFLLPNLTFISTEMFKISPKIAGMTLLALGNSSPDLFSTFYAFNSDKISMALGELLGSGFLCTSLVVGLMGIINEFSVAPMFPKTETKSFNDYEFIFDLLIFSLFLMISIFFINDGILTLVECIIMISLYTLYIGFLIYIYGKPMSIDENSLNDLIDGKCMHPIETSVTDNMQYSDMSQHKQILSLEPSKHQLSSTPPILITITGEQQAGNDNNISVDVTNHNFLDFNQKIPKKSYSAPSLLKINSSFPFHHDNEQSAENHDDKNIQSHNCLEQRGHDITFLHTDYNSINQNNKTINDQIISNLEVPRLTRSISNYPASIFSVKSKADRMCGYSSKIKVAPFGLPYYLMGSKCLFFPSPKNLGSSFQTMHHANNDDHFGTQHCSMESSMEDSFHKLPTNVQMSFIDLFELDSNKNELNCSQENFNPINVLENEPILDLENQDLSIDYDSHEVTSYCSINDMNSFFCHDGVCDLHTKETLSNILFPFSKAWNCTPDSGSNYDGSNVSSWKLQTYMVILRLCARLVIILNIIPFFLIRITIPRVSDFHSLLCECEVGCNNSETWKSYRQLLLLQSFMFPWLLFLATSQPITSITRLLTTFCFSCCIYQITHKLLLKTNKKSTTLMLDDSSSNGIPFNKKNLKSFLGTIAVIGFFNSMVWISYMASLVISVLVKIGAILHISDSLLGLTLFAIGNSVGDIITNLTFAKLDLAMIGIGSCFGSPLLYTLFGIGFNGTLIILKNYFFLGHNQLFLSFQVSPSLKYCVIGLITVQVFYAICIPFNKWIIDRKIGIVGVSIWIIITSFNIIKESFFC